MPAPKRATKTAATAEGKPEKRPAAATKSKTAAASKAAPAKTSATKSAPKASTKDAPAKAKPAAKPAAAKAEKAPATTKAAAKETTAKATKAAAAKATKAAAAKADAKAGASKSADSKPATKSSTSKASAATTATPTDSKTEKPVSTKAADDKKSSAKSSKSTSKANGADGKSPFDKKFLEEQRALLLEERAKYMRSAQLLKEEADALAAEREPGDVQFDEESGEGDTLAVERDFDLALSAQARQQVEEIDAALARIDEGTYGICRVSGLPIPKERLRAIPWATERVEYKVGGLGRR